jgi:two-component system phosphate regulon sensor histidine kinase PhoR
MEKRNTVQILGIFSIVILISVQVFIIRGIWKQKDEMFALRYTMLSQEALNYFRRTMPSDGFDTVRLLLGRYSEQANKEIHAIKNEQELTARKKDILDYFTKVVNQEQDLSVSLSSYFEMRGFEKKFNFKIIIDDLEMISDDTVVVYRSAEYSPRRPSDRGRRTSSAVISGSNILVRGYGIEDNNYRLFFNFFIDFSDKQKLILRETAASLAMSGISIIVVVLLFMITYRNLMEEKRLSDLKTDFINNMTHELKTPLSTITVAGKTLEMEQINSSKEKILETARLIGKQSIHLNQLINLILEISMWERTQFQLDKKPVRVDELMNEIVESFRSGCNTCAKITQKYDLENIKSNLDVVYFTTMINNLLSNAVKYSDKEPEINVEGFSDKEHVYIKVSDNGIGINKVDQKHIFDKFYRVSTGNIHKIKGLGLGLYYVKRIAESHGGDVSVESKPGKGSIFTVTLPY